MTKKKILTPQPESGYKIHNGVSSPKGVAAVASLRLFEEITSNEL